MKHLDPTAVHEQPSVVVYPFDGERLGNSWGTVGEQLGVMLQSDSFWSEIQEVNSKLWRAERIRGCDEAATTDGSSI